jgi:ketosteroid isomerase-like protein
MISAREELSAPNEKLITMADAEHATHPEDLSRLIVERLNAGDVDGLVALYEPDAVLVLPDGRIATRSNEIRRA